MAGTITTARLKVSSDGAKGVAGQLDQVGKATERVGRAQTRLGQAAASSGRQFAAQASGLGGLVAAYAGAAATVFALQAAFDALNKAARAETIIAGTKALALEIGQSGPKILKEVKAITQGQIELSEAAQNINIALSAGFNTEQISRLTKVSLGASRALGRNLTDALQRVVRGAAKLEPELLDELGIFTRIDPAVNKYAQRLGVAATTLTDFERRQAFVNAVITEGERKFSAIDTTSKSTQKSLEQLQTQVQELALQFGALVANALLPLVDFFKNNAGNALLLFGGILALVFGKSVEIIKNFANTSVGNFTRFADNIVTQSQNSRGAIDTLTAGLKEYNKELGTKRSPSFASLAVRREGATLSRADVSDAASARQRFLAGGAGSDAQRKEDIRALSRVRDAVEKNTTQYDQANKIIQTYEKANNSASKAARIKAGAVNLASTALKGLATTAALAASAVNKLFAAFAVIQLVGTLFDVDVIGMIKDMFRDLSQAAKDVEQGFKGVAVAAAGGGAALTKALTSITNDQKVLQEFPKQLRALNEEMKTLAAIETQPGGVMSGLDLKAVTDAQLLNAAKQQLLVVEERLIKARRDGETKDIQAAKIRILQLNTLINRTQKYGSAIDSVVGELSRRTGVAGDLVTKSFDDGALGVEKLNKTIRIAGILLTKIGKTYSLDFLSEDAKEAIDAQIIFNKVLEETNEAFSAGALNSDKLSAKIAGLGTQILEIQEKGGVSGIAPGPGAIRDVEKLREEVEKLRDLQRELKALETVSKGIAKAFGSAFTALDTAPFKGIIDLSGNLAENSNEAKINQAEFLKSVIQTNEKFAEQVKNQKAGEKLDSIITERAQNFQLAVKAAAGSIIEYYQTAQKVAQEEKVKAQQLDKQLQTLKDQQAVQKLQRDNALQIEVDKQMRDLAQARFKIAEKQLENRKQQASLADKELDLTLKLAQATASNAAATNKLAATRRGTGAQADESARAMNLSILTNQLEILNEKSFKDQTVINAKRREIIELERQYAEERFTEQKTLIEKELKESLELLNVQKEIEKSRLESLKQQKTDLEKFNTDQLALFDRQSKLETQKLTDQKDQLERERRILMERAGAQLNASEADEKIFNQQSQLTIAQLKGYQSFSEAVNTFISATGDKSPFVQAVAEILGVAQGADAGAAFKDNLVKIPQQTTAALSEALALTQGNIDRQGEIFRLQRKGITDQLQGENELNNQKQIGITAQIQNQEKLRTIERDILSQSLAGKVKELDLEIQIQQERLKGLSLEELQQRADATQKIEELEQQRNRTLQELNQRIDAVTRSEDRLGQALDQSQSIVRDSVTGAFMKLNDALIDGSITMGMVGNTFRDMVGNMLREIQQAVFRKTIVDPLSTAISSSIPGLGSLFGGGVNPGAVVAGNVGAPGMSVAGGGRVHMAGGGMKRDRVPAMLEPGEFVMRKDAVKQFGVDTMMRMNAAPRGYQSGGIVGSDANKNTPYDPARAAQLMEMGIPAAAAVALAQQESAKSTSDSTFSFSNSEARRRGIGSNMGLEPKYSAPVSGKQALDAVNKMLGIDPTKTRGTLTPSDLQSMRGTTPGTMQTAGVLDDIINSLPSFKRDPKALQDQFKGTKSRKKSKGVGDFLNDNVINPVKRAFGVTNVSFTGTPLSKGPNNAPPANDVGIGFSNKSLDEIMGTPSVDPMTPGLAELATSLVGVQGMDAQMAMDVATLSLSGKGIGDINAPLDQVLGSTGVQLDTANIPGIGLAVRGLRALTGNQSLGRFQLVDKSIPTPTQARARVSVFNRTGTMATGNKFGFQRGDVTPSGNFMTQTAPGVVSNIDPFSLDKAGFPASVTSTMGGGMGFRRAGTGIEYSGIGDFITALTTPGRQTALTPQQYNAMSEEGRMAHSPGLQGSRNISAFQQAQLNQFGGYRNNVGGYTIPGGTIRGGTIGTPDAGLVSRIETSRALGIFDGRGRFDDGSLGYADDGVVGGVSRAGTEAGFTAFGDFGYEEDLASGGLARLKKYAAGGAVQSRDRVPALLEPGEFVIRRPSAKAIGGPALNQMNATGKNLTPPNIEVNLNNQGAPKNATAQPARVQGDKIIIDMITRDLRNNGPIKKSLRK